MNPLEFLNSNPALTSLIAFPLGLVLLLATAKYAGLGKVYADTLDALKEHTAAEIKIEERLSDVVGELKNVGAAQWDNRRYIDEKLDHVEQRFDRIQEKQDFLATLVDTRMDRLEKMMPKRKDDKDA